MDIVNGRRDGAQAAGADRPGARASGGGSGTTAPQTAPAGSTAPRRPFAQAGIRFDRSRFADVLSACLGPSAAIQDACAQIVLDAPKWFVDFEAGTLSFGEVSYPVQLLGSESSADGTWMWGWNNINGFPASVLRVAEWVRGLGREWGLKELTTDCFPMTEGLSGSGLAAVATVLAPGSLCYYRGPYDGGAVLLAFSGLPGSVFAPVDEVRFSRILVECLQVPCNHRILTESFLAWNGTDYRWEGRRITARFPTELVIEFDESERLTRVATA